MPSIELILIAASVLVIFSILASKLATRMGVPALLLFLGVGMLAGADGPGGIFFDNPWLTQSIGVIALALILFAGGLDTHWPDIRPVLGKGVALATVGVLVTALSVGLLGHLALGWPLREAILLGAIISSTDAAAVFAVLRGRGLRLKKPVQSLLELESGSNDPMAVFLTIGMIALITQPGRSEFDLIPMFIQQMAVGALAGYGAGRLGVRLLNSLRLEYDGLYSVLTLTLALLSYAGTTVLGGNGFLAVYLAGIVMGNRPFIHQRSLIRFHDGLSWLMQITMFLTLGLQVFPSELPAIIPTGLLVAGFLIFIARPLAVFLVLLPVRQPFREKVFIAWVGLRGAAPIILATFPLLAGLPQAETIFNLVFFIVLTSVLLQGTLIAPAARRLGVEDETPVPPPFPLEMAPGEPAMVNYLEEFSLPPGSPLVGKQILELGLPSGALVVLLRRKNGLTIPSGGMALEESDSLLVLAQGEAQEAARRILGRTAS